MRKVRCACAVIALLFFIQLAKRFGVTELCNERNASTIASSGVLFGAFAQFAQFHTIEERLETLHPRCRR